MSNVNKPTIPCDVAEVIENLRNRGFRNVQIVRAAQGTVGPDLLSAREYRVLYQFVTRANGGFDTLMAALVNGYEVEKSAEAERQAAYERIRDAYHRKIEFGTFEHDGLSYVSGRSIAYADGIKFALNELGVKIPGVNVPETEANV